MIFADTSSLLALLSPRDHLHVQAMAFRRSRETRLLTTTWVLMELGNAVSDSSLRRSFVELLLDFTFSPTVVVIPANHNDFLSGFELYQQRPDKEWSLTDCISFLVMQGHGVTEALTADHHFSQAGFQVLLQN